MGCEVTSVYNDEIVGKMGYSQLIIDDLLARDFRTPSPLTLPQQASLQNIYGFGQSYATGKVFFTVVAQIQCTVMVAGRCILVQEMKSGKRRWIVSKDAVSALDVREKLCLVGLSGGELVLWDLQFMEVKLRVLLPEGSLTAATVSLTTKFLFATDSSQPNNMAFCYDIRTAKLRASAVVPSLEPALKGTAVNDDTHATCCADGVWFMRMEKGGELRVTRGMFGHYPKTSMCCLAQAGGYVISGGVDGYIYAWRLATLRCVKAVKVHEGEITAMAVKNGQVVLASSGGRVKIYSYKVAKNEKKTVVVEDEEAKVEDDDEILTFVLLDTYDKEGTIFSVASSLKDPALYYCQTRQGLLFQKRLPVAEIAPSKKALKTVELQDLLRLNGKAHVELHGGRMFSVYTMSEKWLFLDIHSVEKGRLVLFEERMAKLQSACEGRFTACLPVTNQVALLSKNGRIMVVETFSKVGDALLNADQSNSGQNSRQVMKVGSGEQLLCLNFTSHQQRCFLAVTTSSSVHVFRRQGRLTFEEQFFGKYEKQVPREVQAGEHKLLFQEECLKWREQGESWRPIGKEERERQELLLCCKCKSTDSRWSSAGIILGEGYALFQK